MCFTSRMAKATPSRVSHQGNSGGMATANSTAVTMALKSPSAGITGRLRSFITSASKATASRVAKAILMITPQPK